MIWILILIIAIILIEECCEAAYKKTDNYKKSLGGCDRFYDVPTNLEIVNIGSGPGLFAISYKYSKKKGFNFANAPQNYKYGFRLIKRFHENINPNAVVMIVIMAPMSFGKNNDYERKDYNDKYYGILPKEDIDHYSWKRAFIARHPFALKVLRKAKRLIKSTDTGLQSRYPSSDEPMVVQTWKEEFELKDLRDASQAERHKEAFQEKINILQNGLNYCYEHQWKPVFVIPPIPEETRKYISHEFMNVFVYQNIEILREQNPQLRMLDYFDTNYSKDCFANDIFMNEKGQEKFSIQLFQDVDEIIKKNQMGKNERGTNGIL